MKTEKITWGLVLIFTGSIILLQNLEVIDFNWHVIFRFWPVVLILVGANLLFSRGDGATAAVVSLILTVAVLGFITHQGITTKEEDAYDWSGDEEYNRSGDRSKVFTEPYNDTIARAVLNISGGAMQYVLKDSTSNLFEADVSRNAANYTMFRTSQDSAETLSFKMKGDSDWNLNNRKNNKAVIKLNANPVWDINVELGAGSTKFDLRPFKVNSLHIEGGAASFQLKLGQPVQTTNVFVETGVSKIEIALPESAACKINIESGLSTSDFKDFEKQADGSFTTKNFAGATKSIVLNLEGGLSKFKVIRYPD